MSSGQAAGPDALYTVYTTTTANSSATLTEQAASTQSSSGSGSSSGLSDKNFATRTIVVRSLTDDGVGRFIGEMGTVNYVGRALNFRAVSFDRSTTAYKSDHESASAFENSITASSSSGSSGSTGTGGNTSGSTEGGSSGSNSGSGGSSSRKGGEYGTASVSEEMLGGSSIVVRYRVGAPAPRAKSSTFTPPAVTLDLCPYTSHRVVAGSVQFQWMGQTYTDFEGVIYRNRTDTDPGIASGAMNYEAGLAIMTDYVVGGSGPADFQLQSLWTTPGQWSTASLFFSTDAAPLRAGAGGFVLTVTDLTGAQLTANVDTQGNITGLHMRGKIEFARGQVELQFGDYALDADLTPEQKQEWWYNAADVGAVQADKIWRPWPVDPTTLRYSCVSYIYLPVDVTLMGIDPAALPPDGRVAYARPGDTCVVGITHSGPAFAPALNTYAVGHQRLSFVQVIDDATGAEIVQGYTADLDAGTVQFTDVTGYPALVRVVARTEVYRQIAEVRIDGKVKLTQPVGYAFPAGAVFSTALRQGDRFARVSRVYDQASWNGVTWYDGVDPAVGEAAATFNAAQHPIVVTNRGAITERWALRIKTGGTTFDLYGQHLGLIATGDIGADFAPMNTAAGVPFFTLPAAGWGSGWAAGNVLFIDTIGAEFPIDLVRTVQPSSPAGVDDSFWLVQRGDVDRPPSSGF